MFFLYNKVSIFSFPNVEIPHLERYFDNLLQVVMCSVFCVDLKLSPDPSLSALKFAEKITNTANK